MYEPLCTGQSHIPFNTGMIQVIDKAVSPDHITFYGETAHFQYLMESLADKTLSASLTHCGVRPVPRRSYTTIRPLLHDFWQIYGMIHTAAAFITKARDDAVLFILMSSDASLILAARLVAAMFGSRVVIRIVLHGNLASLENPRSRNPLRVMVDFYSVLTMPFGNCQIRFIVLEHTIKERMIRLLPDIAERVFVLEHPIEPHAWSCLSGPHESVMLQDSMRFAEVVSSRNQNKEYVSQLIEKTVSFGYLGMVSASKGFPLFMKIARKFHHRKYPHGASFYCIGSVSGEDTGLRIDAEALESLPSLSKLTRADFIQRVRKLDFIFLPYESAHYQWSPSGVLMDAVSFAKPIIARSLPMTRRLFEVYGPMGYLFSTEEELNEIMIFLLSEFPQKAYRAFQENLQKAGQDRTPEALAQTCRDIFDV